MLLTIPYNIFQITEECGKVYILPDKVRNALERPTTGTLELIIQNRVFKMLKYYIAGQEYISK